MRTVLKRLKRAPARGNRVDSCCNSEETLPHDSWIVVEGDGNSSSLCDEDPPEKTLVDDMNDGWVVVEDDADSISDEDSSESNHDDDDDEAFERPLQPSPCLSDQIQETPKVSIAASLVGGTPAKYIHPRARERASGVDLLLAPPSVPQVPKGGYHRNRWGGYTAQNSGTWRNASRAAQPATVNIPSHCFLENVQFQGCTQVPSPYEGHLASQAQLPQVLCPPLDGNVAMPAPTSQGIPYGYWPPMGASLFPPQPGYGMPAPLSLQLGLPPSVNNLLPANFSYPLKVQGLMFPPQHLARH